MISSFDIIIIGGGPSGTTAALALGNTGLTVAIIDKSEFPRDKICGDALAAYVPKVLNTIDPSYTDKFLSEVTKVSVNTVRIGAPNGEWCDLTFNEFGFISKRMVLDNQLMEWVKELDNVTVFENQTVSDIVRENGSYIVTTQEHVFNAKLVIGCDGAQGITRKKLAPLKKDSDHYAGAVRAYYKGVEGIPPGTFELHFLKGLVPGYFWIFPLPNGEANVGLGMKTTAISDLKINLKEEMLKVIESDPKFSSRFKGAKALGSIQGYGLPLGSRKVALSGEGFMFCGDAGCLIEPLTGEGIGQAMVSGRYAGWHAKKCFEENNFNEDFMSQYDKTVYDKLWPDHKRRLVIRNIIEQYPSSLSVSVSLVNKIPGLKNIAQKVLW